MFKKFLLPILPVAAFGIGTVAASAQPYADQNNKIDITNNFNVDKDGQKLIQNQTIFTFNHDSLALYDSFWFAGSQIAMTIPEVPTLTAQFTQKVKFSALSEVPRAFYTKPFFSSADKGTVSINTLISMKKNPQNYEIILNMTAIMKLLKDPFFDLTVSIPEFTYSYKQI